MLCPFYWMSGSCCYRYDITNERAFKLLCSGNYVFDRKRGRSTRFHIVYDLTGQVFRGRRARSDRDPFFVPVAVFQIVYCFRFHDSRYSRHPADRRQLFSIVACRIAHDKEHVDLFVLQGKDRFLAHPGRAAHLVVELGIRILFSIALNRWSISSVDMVV